MADVPVYSQPQVQPDQLNPARINPGAVGTGMASIGQGLSNAAAGFQQIKQEADHYVVNDGFLEDQKQVQDLKQGALQVRGKDVFKQTNPATGESTDLLGGVMANFDDIVESRMDKLSNPYQKEIYRQMTDRLRLEVSGQIQAHQNNEAFNWQSQTNQDGVKLAVSGATSAAQMGDMSGVANNLEQAKFFASSQAKLAGVGDENDPIYQENMLGATSAVHTAVIQALIGQSKPLEAATYLKGYGDQIAPDQRARLQGIISGQTSDMKANAAVDSIWSPTAKLEDMANSLRKQFADDPETQKKAQAFLLERDAIHNKTIKDLDERNTGTLWQGVLSGHGLQWVKQQPEYQAMDGTAQVHLLTSIEQYQKRNENDPAQIVAQFAAYMKLTDDPQKLAAASDGAIVSLLPVLGPQLTKELLEAKRKAAGDLDKLQKATLNDVPFKDIALEYGITTQGKKGQAQQEAEASLGLLRNKAVHAIADEQQSTGKPMLPDRKEEVVRGLLKNVTVGNRNWFDDAGDKLPWWVSPAAKVGAKLLGGGTTDKPLFQVDSFMDLAATKDEKDRAVKRLVSSGAMVTPGNVNTMIQAERARTNGGRK